MSCDSCRILFLYFLEHGFLKGIPLPKEEITLISSKSSWPSALPAGSRQTCNQWPGKWWGCTWLLTLPAVLGSLRTGWGPSLAVQRPTRRRPRRKGSRQWGTLRRSTLPPCESRKETAGFIQSSQTLAEQHRARQTARELRSTEWKWKMITCFFHKNLQYKQNLPLYLMPVFLLPDTEQLMSLLSDI